MGNLVPADKKIYALRDVTGTVESIPLIASSIMSKKLASGASNIVIDVKVGNGALMKTIDDSKELAKLLVEIGEHHGKGVVCFITNMDEPLGFAIGNSLEVLESIETLKGNGPSDLTDLVLNLGKYMVSLGKNISLDEAYELFKTNLYNNKAYEKFLELVKCQNGNIDGIKISDNVISIKSTSDGYISKIDALRLGENARIIGAGRLNKEDVIDFEVGIVLSKKVGDYVSKGEELLKVYVHDKSLPDSEFVNCFKIVSEKPLENKLIKEIICK